MELIFAAQRTNQASNAPPISEQSDKNEPKNDGSNHITIIQIIA